MTRDVSTHSKIENLQLPAGTRDSNRAAVEHSQRRRLQLALAMLSCERGHELLSIDDITDHAKLSKGTLYDHFEGREELLASAGDDFRDLARSAAQAALVEAARRDGSGSAGGWPGAVRTAVTALCSTVEAEPELARLTFVEGPAIFIRGDRPDSSVQILAEVLKVAADAHTAWAHTAGATEVAEVPPELDGVQKRALTGAFRSVLQDRLRVDEGSLTLEGLTPGLPEALSHLIVVAHVRESDSRAVPA